MADETTLSFGLLMLPHYQLLDAAGPVDFINTHSRQYWSSLSSLGFGGVAKKAPSIEWHYISHSLEPLQATSGAPQIPTTTYANCPKLDYLIVPGPNPFEPLPEGCAAFLKERLDKELKGLLTVCTGSMAIAIWTDILDGYHLATNKMVLKHLASRPEFEKLKNKVHWVGDKRWVVDGKVWSGGGVTAGIDLAVEFVRKTFDPEVVEETKNILEYMGKADSPDEFAFLLAGVPL